MKTRTCFLTLLLCCAPACGLFSSSPEPVDWKALAQCGPEIPELISDVAEVLLRSGGTRDEVRAELEELAREHTPGTVACLVLKCARQWEPVGQSHSPEQEAARARALDFLNGVGFPLNETSGGEQSNLESTEGMMDVDRYQQPLPNADDAVLEEVRASWHEALRRTEGQRRLELEGERPLPADVLNTRFKDPDPGWTKVKAAGLERDARDIALAHRSGNRLGLVLG